MSKGGRTILPMHVHVTLKVVQSHVTPNATDNNNNNFI